MCFLYDTRLKFLVNGREGGKGAPMSCAMVYWGRRPGRFFDVFIEYGAVSDLSQLKGAEIGMRGSGGRPARRAAAQRRGRARTGRAAP